MSRTDDDGRALKKSQLQVQLWVNRRQDALNSAVIASMQTLTAHDPVLRWVSPMETDRFREYHDGSFLRAIGRVDLVAKLSEFWPSGGPRWDALAVAETAEGDYLGVVLLEGKSYPGEMRSKLAASDATSERRILERLAETREGLGIGEKFAEAWSSRWYQSANRLAHLRWFTEVLEEQAWLVNAYVIDDPDEPTTQAEWDAAIRDAEADLGLTGIDVANSGRVFLTAGERDELLAA